MLKRMCWRQSGCNLSTVGSHRAAATLGDVKHHRTVLAVSFHHLEVPRKSTVRFHENVVLPILACNFHTGNLPSEESLGVPDRAGWQEAVLKRRHDVLRLKQHNPH